MDRSAGVLLETSKWRELRYHDLGPEGGAQLLGWEELAGGTWTSFATTGYLTPAAVAALAEHLAGGASAKLLSIAAAVNGVHNGGDDPAAAIATIADALGEPF